MGMGLYALAGALQGAGKGMTMQAESDATDRRNAAIEKARRENLELEYQLRDQNDASSTARDTTKQIAISNNSAANQTKIAGAGAKARLEEDKQKRKWDEEDREDKQKFDASEAEKTRRAELRKELFKPLETYTDGVSGDVTEIWGKPDGTREVLVRRAAQRPKATEGTGSTPLTKRDGKMPRAATPDYIWDAKSGTLKPAGER